MGESSGSDSEAYQRLADDVAIRNLVARFAYLADTSDVDELGGEYMAVFTEDASWGPAGHERRGCADILEGAVARRRGGELGPGTNSRHVITTQEVRFDGPDTAISDSYYLLIANTLAHPSIRGAGLYRDRLRREEGGWRIASREIIPG